MFERGPRGFRPSGNGLTTLRLLEELGLECEALGTSSAAANRYIWCNNEMIQLPSSPVSMMRDPKLSFMLLSALVQDISTAKSNEKDETVFNFASRRFGTDVASMLVDSMISGIYAGNSKELSVRSCFPLLYELESEYGSVVKGMMRRKKETKPMCNSSKLANFETETKVSKKLARCMQVSFRNGMETLSHRLETSLRQDEEYVTLMLDSRVSKLKMGQNRIGVCVEGYEEGDTHFDHVISTLPANTMARLLSSSDKTGDAFQDLARNTKGVDVAVVNMGYQRDTVELPYDGFGFLVPSREYSELLGTTWDSLVFPQQQKDGTCVMTAMIGGAHHPHIGAMSNSDIEEMAQKLVLSKLNISEKPDTIYCDVARDCIPQYRVGHHEKVSQVEALLRDEFKGRVHAIGTSLYGVGVADLVYQALRKADNVNNL